MAGGHDHSNGWMDVTGPQPVGGILPELARTYSDASYVPKAGDVVQIVTITEGVVAVEPHFGKVWLRGHDQPFTLGTRGNITVSVAPVTL